MTKVVLANRFPSPALPLPPHLVLTPTFQRKGIDNMPNCCEVVQKKSARGVHCGRECTVLVLIRTRSQKCGAHTCMLNESAQLLEWADYDVGKSNTVGDLSDR
eukprot:gb/GEZN01007791.1/.p1 GENE.gb/GEZN01007791.1/~~gb/GEZN01007791.1/.p1  ORF type:complete len:103 (+),score=0.12 gb/GEZN01007791.1/:343-651(+)